MQTCSSRVLCYSSHRSRTAARSMHVGVVQSGVDDRLDTVESWRALQLAPLSARHHTQPVAPHPRSLSAATTSVAPRPDKPSAILSHPLTQDRPSPAVAGDPDPASSLDLDASHPNPTPAPPAARRACVVDDSPQPHAISQHSDSLAMPPPNRRPTSPHLRTDLPPQSQSGARQNPFLQTTPLSGECQLETLTLPARAWQPCQMLLHGPQNTSSPT
jgi:hypothetical protein